MYVHLGDGFVLKRQRFDGADITRAIDRPKISLARRSVETKVWIAIWCVPASLRAAAGSRALVSASFVRRCSEHAGSTRWSGGGVREPAERICEECVKIGSPWMPRIDDHPYSAGEQ